MEEEDRISSLPECLIVEILSRLESTTEAVKLSTLSKQWMHLWTLVPNLIIDINMFPAINRTSTLTKRWIISLNSDLCSLVDKIITQCGGKLKNLNKLQISVGYSPLTDLHVNNWIHYAISRNVQEIHLLKAHLLFFSYDDAFVLPQSIYNNACFTKLTLEGCIFNPTGSVEWKNLKTLSLSYVKLDEDLIQKILSGSPVLETFELTSCYGYTRIDITSKSVENLVFSGDRFMSRNAPSVIELNAPYTLSLTVNRFFDKRLLLLNVSSLIKAELNFWNYCRLAKNRQEMLEDFILNLRHVKELKICGKVFTGSRLFES